jgi:ABC-type transport system involved in cytochrome c biogenesis permease subunit
MGVGMKLFLGWWGPVCWLVVAILFYALGILFIGLYYESYSRIRNTLFFLGHVFFLLSITNALLVVVKQIIIKNRRNNKHAE